MPISNVTPYTGDIPDLGDPVTFDARMTTFSAWFDSVMSEVKLTIDDMNTALNDNGTVLDATADAVARVTNMSTPVLSTGTAIAYTLTPAVAVPSYDDGQTFLVRMHTANGVSPTLKVGALGVLPIQIRNSANVLAAPAVGLLGTFEEFFLTVTAGGTIFEVTSQPISEITDLIGLEPIESYDASSDATLNFTGFDAAQFVAYKLIGANVVPVTDGAFLYFRTSTNGGGAYDAGANDYGWCYSELGMDNSPVRTETGDNLDSEIQMTPGVGSAGGEDGFSFELTIYGPHLAKQTMIEWRGVYQNTLGTRVKIDGGGVRLSSADVDAVRFLFSSGAIESGTISMYGLRKV